MSAQVRPCAICGAPRAAKYLDKHGACREGHWIDSANDEAWCAQASEGVSEG